HIVATSPCSLVFVFFFFQAEDGIRAATVTGVQTCALPISMIGARLQASRNRRPAETCGCDSWLMAYPAMIEDDVPRRSFYGRGRSEERRVGKECRWGGWPGHG